MGQPRVDLDKALALAAQLEDEETLVKLSLGERDPSTQAPGQHPQNRTLSPTCPRRVSPNPLRSVPSKLNSRDPTAVST